LVISLPMQHTNKRTELNYYYTDVITNNVQKNNYYLHKQSIFLNTSQQTSTYNCGYESWRPETPSLMRSVTVLARAGHAAHICSKFNPNHSTEDPLPTVILWPNLEMRLRTLSFQDFIIILQPRAADKKEFLQTAHPPPRSWTGAASRIVSISGTDELFVLPLLLVFYLAVAVGFYFRPTSGRCTSPDQNKRNTAELKETNFVFTYRDFLH
jgi:hypothetical protein